MNHFQRARDEALRVRSLLLGEASSTPIPAPEILGGIESKVELCVLGVPARFSKLGNGDAVLRRNEKFIYYRNDLAPADTAYLVTHELGHWYLDDKKSTVTIASLASMSSAQGTPGVIAVEAYGAHEREELQANVFARELLLPRTVALSMFNAGRGPRIIAHELRIPLEVARQQVMDAVMLPTLEPPATSPLHPLKPDQESAAKATEDYVNVVAGPGTGKTSTLIHRVKHLIEEKGVNPAHILVLTFTNKAAAELVDRLRSCDVRGTSDLWVGTFHSFGLEFLRKYHNCFELDDDIRVADDLSAITMLSSLLPRAKLKYYRRVEDPYFWLTDVHGAIKRLKEELVTPEEYRARLARLPQPDEALTRKREDVATLYELYEQGLKDRKLVDFVDLVGKPAIAIAGDRARYSELANQFQHILVDEYQDVTEAMVVLVRQMSHLAKSLWVVGDIRQAIHHWRGASFRSLTKFELKFETQLKNGKTLRKYPLRTNFRSTPEILALVSDLGRQHVLEESLPFEEMEANNKTSGERPLLVSCYQELSAIPKAVVIGIQKACEAGIPYGDQAVLCRWGDDVETVADALQEAGIPTLYLGPLPQRREVKPILCLMQLLIERQPRTLLGFAEVDALQIPANDYQVIMDHVKTNPRLQRGHWRNTEIPGISAEATASIDNLVRLLRGQTNFTTAWSFVCDMVLEHRFCLPRQDDVSLRARISRLALWQFAYSARAGNGDSRNTTLTRYLLRLQLRQKINDFRSDKELPPEAAALDAVRVQTIHTSKGLEYGAVHVGFVNAYSFGGSNTGYSSIREVLSMVPPEVLESSMAEYTYEQAIERNNLLYVAASRPKSSLYLYDYGPYSKSNLPPQLKASEEQFDTCDYVQEDSGYPVEQSAQPVPGRVPLTFEEFHTYTQCPLQYWYRHVLGLPREIEADAPLRARFAIMQTLQDIASGKSKQSKDELARQWELQRLPPKNEDPALWEDACVAVADGLRKLAALSGTYEEVTTTVGGVQIKFPWAIVDRRDGHTNIQFPYFLPYMPSSQTKLIRPMLSGVNYGRASATGFSILAEKSEPHTPSGSLTATDGYKAAQKFASGNRAPCRGKQCKWCSYVTICPQVPV